MSARTVQEVTAHNLGEHAKHHEPWGPRWTGLDAEGAQALFRAQFDHEPLIDVRTPAQVRAERSK